MVSRKIGIPILAIMLLLAATLCYQGNYDAAAGWVNAAMWCLFEQTGIR